MRTGAVRIFGALALAGLAAAIWIAGPMVGYGGFRPLASPWLRGGLIGAVLAAVVLGYLWRALRRRRAEKRLQAVLSGPLSERDPEGLGNRMAEALAAFRARSRRRNPLRTLPWYVVLGPKGAGKTTALNRCGLTLPPDADAPVPGVRPTEFCDWWFTDEAVLVDTAGRYALHRPDAPADRAAWLALLALALRTRPRQPINGVILVFSLEDLMLLPDAELDAHLTTLRARLAEIATALTVRFPVYVLFTKADLVAGFAEYFGRLDAGEKAEAWGAALAGDAPGPSPEAPAAFDALAARLAGTLSERLGGEPELAARRLVFLFPQQFERLKARVGRFLGAVAQPQGGAPPLHSLRGFWFSSGAREGRPVDLLRPQPARLASVQREAAADGFFLEKFLPGVVLAEKRWVGRRSPTARRGNLVRRAALALIALACLGGLGALGVSFAANHRLIRQSETALAEEGPEAARVLSASTVGDTDLAGVVAALGTLRGLPAGYGEADAPVPVWETFGLSERPRLRSAAETAYARALERLLRPRLMLQLEQKITGSLREPAAIYEPLKIYLMLGGKAPRADDPLIAAWFGRDWERDRYPGAVNREGRARLAEHLDAMLALDDGGTPAVEPDGRLVESAQRSLSRLELADLAAALVASALPAANLPDVTVETLAGPQAGTLFDASDGSDVRRLSVPGLYTHAGFNRFFLPELAALGEKLGQDQWVLGAGGEQVALQAQLGALGPRLLDRYSQDFLAAWNRVLAQVRMRPVTEGAPAYPALAAAAAAESPLRLMIEGVARETGLTGGADTAADSPDAQRIDEGLRRIGLSLFGGKGQNRAGEAPGSAGAPGAAAEAQFRAYGQVVEGEAGARPVDLLVRNFSDILGSLVLAANSPGQAERASANLQLQIANLRANASRFPRAVARMVQAAAGDLEGNAASASVTELRRSLEDEVTKPCRAALAGAYPFDRAATRDLAVADFSALFAPDGPIDRFFVQNLAQYADTSGAAWAWRQDTPLGRTLSPDTLKSFQAAARIRDAFFARAGAQAALAITLAPQSLHGDVDMALLEIGGQIVQSYQSGSVPATVSWPEIGSSPLSVNLTPEIPGRPSSVAFSGPWGLMRLLDTGTVSASGDAAQARVVIGGRDVTYSIKTGNAANPFLPPGLSDFTCPAGL